MIDPELSEFLRERGVSEGEVDEAHAAGTLPLLVIDKVLFPNPPRYDEDALIGAVGVDVDLARALWRAMGFPLVHPGDVAFYEEDLEALRAAVGPARLAADGAVHQTRTISAAMSRVAEQVTDQIVAALRDLREQGVDDALIARRFTQTVAVDQLDRILTYVFRRQLRAVVWRRLAEPDPSQATPDLTVGFVDLVRFAAVTESVADEELDRIIGRFEDVAHWYITEGGGRVVKMIGDAVMFVADDPLAAVDVALRLVDAYANDDLLPPARAGLALGPTLERGGDYFGPVVNLASRIVDVARPSRVVVSPELHHAVDAAGRFAFRRLPPKRLKGMGLVTLWAVASER